MFCFFFTRTQSDILDTLKRMVKYPNVMFSLLPEIYKWSPEKFTNQDRINYIYGLTDTRFSEHELKIFNQLVELEERNFIVLSKLEITIRLFETFKINTITFHKDYKVPKMVLDLFKIGNIQSDNLPESVEKMLSEQELLDHSIYIVEQGNKNSTESKSVQSLEQINAGIEHQDFELNLDIDYKYDFIEGNREYIDLGNTVLDEEQEVLNNPDQVLQQEGEKLILNETGTIQEFNFDLDKITHRLLCKYGYGDFTARESCSFCFSAKNRPSMVVWKEFLVSLEKRNIIIINRKVRGGSISFICKFIA